MLRYCNKIKDLFRQRLTKVLCCCLFIIFNSSYANQAGSNLGKTNTSQVRPSEIPPKTEDANAAKLSVPDKNQFRSPNKNDKTVIEPSSVINTAPPSVKEADITIKTKEKAAKESNKPEDPSSKTNNEEKVINSEMPLDKETNKVLDEAINVEKIPIAKDAKKSSTGEIKLNEKPSSVEKDKIKDERQIKAEKQKDNNDNTEDKIAKDKSGDEKNIKNIEKDKPDKPIKNKEDNEPKENQPKNNEEKHEKPVSPPNKIDPSETISPQEETPANPNQSSIGNEKLPVNNEQLPVSDEIIETPIINDEAISVMNGTSTLTNGQSSMQIINMETIIHKKTFTFPMSSASECLNSNLVNPTFLKSNAIDNKSKICKINRLPTHPFLQCQDCQNILRSFFKH